MCTICAAFKPIQTDTCDYEGLDTGEFASVLESGPGGDAASNTSTTNSISIGDVFQGTLSAAGDQDWIRLTLTAGDTVEINIDGVGATALEDPYLEIWNSSGTTMLASDDDGGPGRNSFESFTATYTGDIYINARAYNNAYAGEYTVSVATPQTSGAPLEVWTNDQAANYLVSGYWGESGRSARAFDVGVGGTITVNITALNSAGQNLAVNALEAWSSVTGLNFSYSSSSSAQIVFDDTGSFQAQNSSTTSGNTIIQSNITVSQDWINAYGTTIGSYGFSTYVHEVGHALGLGHGGNYNGSATYTTTYTANTGYNIYLNDSRQLSVMSYMSQTENTWLTASHANNTTAQIADIIAIQTLYGTTGTIRTGDTTYGENGNTGTFLDSLAGLSNSVTYTIYDEGGIDTLDFGSATQAQEINLNPETASNVGGRIGNVLIARDTIIENVISGSGSDEITGNDADNIITGGGGDDDIDGGAGNDIVVISGNIGDFVINTNSGITTVTGNGQTVSVTNVEIIRFDDADYPTQSPFAPDFSMDVGVMESAFYGNGFNGLSDSDGKIAGSFDGTGNDMELSFQGYDIDNDTEIEVFVNGFSVGYLGTGVNNGYSNYTLSITAAQQFSGMNVFEFVQTGSPAWKWGVGNFLLVTAGQADTNMAVGQIENVSYGNGYEGLTDADGRLSVGFQGGTEDLVLALSAFDIDYEGELDIRLNGESIGFLDAGVNNGTSLHTVDISLNQQQSGQNVLTFVQTGSPAWAWGVGDFHLATGETDIQLAVGSPTTDDFGNGYQGLNDADGRIGATFQGTGNDMMLSFNGYDIDNNSEVAVFVNGLNVGSLDAGVNNGFSSHSIFIAGDQQVGGENTIEFFQTGSSAWAWGVGNMSLAELTPEVILNVGQTETQSYGNGFSGLTDADGIITAGFLNNGETEYTLTFEGYDIDFDGEVILRLNGEVVGSLTAGVDSGFASYEFTISAPQLVDGENSLSFVQTANPNWAWGIRNILVTQPTAADVFEFTEMSAEEENALADDLMPSDSHQPLVSELDGMLTEAEDLIFDLPPQTSLDDQFL